MIFPILFLLFLSVPLSTSQLTLDYYKQTCPAFESIVQEHVFNKQNTIPATAAGVVRLFFHDCITDGCDASIIITSNAYNKSERDADLNESLSGDAFDIISKIKSTLELKCPGIVSCSDIIAQATRDLVKMVGGPFYNVLLGRKDSLISNVSKVEESIPRPNMTMDKIIEKFTRKGFNVREMVALTGAHTIGFTHCKEFSDRLFNFSKTSETDPTIHPKYAAGLRNLCKDYLKNPAITAFNDIRSPSKFDNAYYHNILKGLGLLKSDYLLAADLRTRPIVEEYARNQKVFFNDFAKAMEKLSLFGVKSGEEGEVRNKCEQFNNLPF